MSIEIQVLSDVTDEDVRAINRLLPQLSGSAPPLDLTTRPSRDAASRLYERLGFALRDTLVYRLADGGGH